jgi:hypothetical protein
LLIENVDIRVVDNAVANRAIEPNDTIDLVAQPCCDPTCERLNRRGVAVDKATRASNSCMVIINVARGGWPDSNVGGLCSSVKAT